MVYVVAFEEDGYARDVTPRYAKDYGARVAKMQEVGAVRGRRKQWWERVVGVVRRPYRLVSPLLNPWMFWLLTEKFDVE
jgi:xeroderma pigmentosum group C-complementing protein